MNTTSASTLTLESLEQRLNALADTVRHLATEVTKLRQTQSSAKPKATITPTPHEKLMAKLLAEGAIVKPPPEMLAIGAEWDAVPEEEKRALDETLRNLQLDPPLSEMMSKMRGGWYPDESERMESVKRINITWMPMLL